MCGKRSIVCGNPEIAYITFFSLYGKEPKDQEQPDPSGRLFGHFRTWADTGKAMRLATMRCFKNFFTTAAPPEGSSSRYAGIEPRRRRSVRS